MSRAFAALAFTLLTAAQATASEPIPSVRDRFAQEEVAEVPDFQRHVLPLMGRLGCNTRSCHGSFQGQGGFRLSLFGYDFAKDREALMEEGTGRLDLETPEVSKILSKPTLGIPHKGGKRMEENDWAYRLFVRWIEGGAKGADTSAKFDRLEISPAEIVFDAEGRQVPLRVVAHWSDGTAEDVTALARFRTNDESIAEVDEDGMVTSTGPGDTHVVAFYDNGVGVTPVVRPVSDKAGPNYPEVPARTEIDRRVVDKLRKLGIVPAEVCTDSEFLRRVSLDLTGTLPTPAEVESFEADQGSDKRARKIDELLQRPTYAAWWTNRLCDITGNNPRFFQNQPGGDQIGRQWYEWLYSRVRDNTPYDQLMAGVVMATSRKPGQSYEDYAREQSSYFWTEDRTDFKARETMPYFWARRDLAKAEDKALAFSYAFLGVRLECAQCHKHPFDQWTQDDFNKFTAFFAPVTYALAPDARAKSREMTEQLGLDKLNGGQANRELSKLVKEGKVIPWREVFVARNGNRAARKSTDKAAPVRRGRVITPKLLGGEEVEVASGEDPRQPLMDWMRDAENPYFARSFVNRVWANYFHRGLIAPTDDLNLANPASNEAVMEYLVTGFVDHGFDMKWLHREILNSDTYQRGWQTNETNRLDERNFSRAVVRRLPAEVLIDAVAQATASATALQVAASEVDNRTFGPNSGAGYGRRGINDYASRVFGRATRDTNCDCNRSDEPNLLQSIYLQNDGELLGQIDRKDGWVSELAASLRRDAAPDADRDAGLDAREKQVADLERRLENVKAKAPERARRIEERLKAMRAEVEAERQKQGTVEDKPEPVAAESIDRLITEAYLRTLSRRPGASELATARDYLSRATSPARGLADVLWALLNTKEFITNH